MREIQRLFEIIEKYYNTDKKVLFSGESYMTYKQLCEKSMLIACNLYKDCGISAGDRVALLLPNCPEFVSSFFAVSFLGGIVVPIGTRIRELELEFILYNSGAKVLIAINRFDDYNFSQTILHLKKKLPELIQTYVFGKYDGDALSRFSKLEEPCNIRDLEKQITSASEKITQDSVSLMLYLVSPPCSSLNSWNLKKQRNIEIFPH